MPSIALSEVISALTFALDLAEGAVPGHALRSCLLGMRLGAAIGLPASTLKSLYYALLLKDVGCSSNAAHMARIASGDDIRVKYAAKLADWTKPHRVDRRTLHTLWTNVLPESGPVRRATRLVSLGVHQARNNREIIALRCERGAEIMRMLEMGDEAAETVRLLDEHWNGSGYPERMRGPEIPLLSRICSVAQTLDVFAMEDGIETSIAVVKRRSGSWFDPELVRVAISLHAGEELWEHCRRGDSPDETRRAVLAIDPWERFVLGPEGIDRVCEAFAGVVDAKSPFTHQHSLRVTEVAGDIAGEMGLRADRIQIVRRAALLHDLGKLCVPNVILDKCGPLSAREWVRVREHPAVTRSILQRVGAFDELAAIAAEHHERADGSGYPNQLTAEDTTFESRAIALADQYAALTEQRSYHTALSPAAALEMIGARYVPHKQDATCFAALEAVVMRAEPGRDVPPLGGVPLTAHAAAAFLPC